LTGGGKLVEEEKTEGGRTSGSKNKRKKKKKENPKDATLQPKHRTGSVSKNIYFRQSTKNKGNKTKKTDKVAAYGWTQNMKGR